MVRVRLQAGPDMVNTVNDAAIALKSWGST